jgi:hypothetical protein
MVENPQPMALDDIVAALIDEAQGGNAILAVASLEALVRQNGAQLREEDLRALARLDAYAGTSSAMLWPHGPVSTKALRAAVEQVMRQRGLWRRFRIREFTRPWLEAAQWGVALIAMAVALIAAVFLAVVGTSHALRWLGF